MKNISTLFIAFFLVNFSCSKVENNEGITLVDLALDPESPASMIELSIPSDSVMLQGLIYKANGAGKHPTLLLLHGYPGNERNLDIAQVVRAQGWNVVYFNYRGSWGNEGKFSLENSVKDVVNTVNWITTQKALQVDPENIVLFGHSLGGFICLKAIQELPTIKKGFALSTFDIYGDFKDASTMGEIIDVMKAWGTYKYHVLNTSIEEIFTPVLDNPQYFDLTLDYEKLKNKKLIILDEHPFNARIAHVLGKNNPNLKYEIWDTDHSFTNKRISLIKEVLNFINK